MMMRLKMNNWNRVVHLMRMPSWMILNKRRFLLMQEAKGKRKKTRRRRLRKVGTKLMMQTWEKMKKILSLLIIYLKMSRRSKEC